MKVVTIVGTRPELIRLSRIIPKLDESCDHRFVHTGQNFTDELSDIFFRDLGLRRPDVHFGIRVEGFGKQASRILESADTLLEVERPDRVLLLGDTNSALSAIVAARRGIPVFHLEAGNRCYDDRVPEEINRRLIDHSSTILLPYTERSKENLVREGIERERIYVLGNPIFEVIETYKPGIDASDALKRLGVAEGKYFLATFHRSENVDEPARLGALLESVSRIADDHGLDLLVSLHPRTADKMKTFGLSVASRRVRLLAPMGFFDFVRLERSARAVLSDSGTVQEECAIFGVPNVTLRDVTERPETLECGSNVLAGVEHASVDRALRLALAPGTPWTPPAGYTEPNVSTKVAKIVLGHLSLRRHGG